jgi:hypothetical protein
MASAAANAQTTTKGHGENSGSTEGSSSKGM